MLHPEDGGPPSKRLRPDNPVSASAQKINFENGRNYLHTLGATVNG